MKHRYFLFAILLLLCVFMLGQESRAEIRFQVVGSPTITTSVTDKDNITITVQITSEAGDKSKLIPSLTKKVSGGLLGNPFTFRITKTKLDIDGAGTHTVKLTLPRTEIPNVGTYTKFAVEVHKVVDDVELTVSPSKLQNCPSNRTNWMMLSSLSLLPYLSLLRSQQKQIELMKSL